MLAGRYVELLEGGWAPVFKQGRTLVRSVEHALAWPCSLGRRTLSRDLVALGRSQADWSADYRLFSRSPWQAGELFRPVWEEYLRRYLDGPIVVALDDTKVHKTGRKISTAFWQRDPMSPPFCNNFIWGQRFIQVSLVFPHHREAELAARAYPVAFEEAPAVKKPGRRATEEQRAAYRKEKRKKNLSTQAHQAVKDLRERLDQSGAQARPIRLVVDGGFCNRAFFRSSWERIDLLARCRKDARLCRPAPAGGRRRYDPEVFTPEQIRQSETEPWQTVSVFYGGAWREVRCKSLDPVLWKRGAGTRRLRLIVLAPTPYRTSRRAPLNYHDPAYLLTTDLTSALQPLIQDYCDRWQIEVNHRDEKEVLKVGQTQVRASQSVNRHPAFLVACYSLLLLAGLLEFGPGRNQAFPALPKWRRNAKRASLVDLLVLLRQGVNETSVSPHLTPQNLLLRAWG